jgi:hypothetical protein
LDVSSVLRIEERVRHGSNLGALPTARGNEPLRYRFFGEMGGAATTCGVKEEPGRIDLGS